MSKFAVASGLGAGLAFAFQGMFAFALFRLYSATEVGTFTATSQIAFFWMTMALAQAPLHWLVNASQHRTVRRALIQAVIRFIFLTPLVVTVLLLLDTGNYAATVVWALLLGSGQIGWQMAQSAVIHSGTPYAILICRIAPPSTALLGATLCSMYVAPSAEALLVSAGMGYWIGAMFVTPYIHQPGGGPHDTTQPSQRDDRSIRLRFWHTFWDASSMLILFLVWKKCYGAADTGYLGAGMRLVGFAPSIVYATWTHILLGRHQSRPTLKPMTIAALGIALVMVLGICGDAVIRWGWINPTWVGMQNYLAPIMLWQSAACLLAAFGHMPFRASNATQFSQFAILLNIGIIAMTVAPVALGLQWTSVVHLWLVTVVATLSIAAISWQTYRTWLKAGSP